MNSNEKVFKREFVIVFLALFSCFLWGSAFPSIKIGYILFSISQDNTYLKILFAGYRFFIASCMIFLFCKVTLPSLKINKNDILKLFILGIFQTCIQYIFFYLGLSNTTGIKGSIIGSTGTFFSVIIAHFVYEEDRLNVKKIIGVIVGFIGVVVVNMKGGSFDFSFKVIGEGFLIISSLSGAISAVYTKKLSTKIPPVLLTAYQMFIGATFLIISGILGGARPYLMTYSFKGTMLLIYMAFISAAAFSIWTILLKYNGVGKISIFKFTIPVFGVFLSSIFLNESIRGANTIIAVVLVCIGIFLINKN